MNKSYRLVYSEVTNTWVAVSELTKAKGKKSSLKTIGSVLATSIMATFGLAQAGTIALNLPVGTITTVQVLAVSVRKTVVTPPSPVKFRDLVAVLPH
mgnify:CR=1 FL=1